MRKNSRLFGAEFGSVGRARSGEGGEWWHHHHPSSMGNIGQKEPASASVLYKFFNGTKVTFSKVYENSELYS